MAGQQGAHPLRRGLQVRPAAARVDLPPAAEPAQQHVVRGVVVAAQPRARQVEVHRGGLRLGGQQQRQVVAPQPRLRLAPAARGLQVLDHEGDSLLQGGVALGEGGDALDGERAHGDLENVGRHVHEAVAEEQNQHHEQHRLRHARLQRARARVGAKDGAGAVPRFPVVA